MRHTHTDRALLLPTETDADSYEPAPAPKVGSLFLVLVCFVSPVSLFPPMNFSKLSRTPALPQGVAPKRPEVGEHTVSILQEYNFSEKEISQFLSQGVVSKL